MLFFRAIDDILVIVSTDNFIIKVKDHKGLVLLFFVILFYVTTCGRVACKQHFEILFLGICQLSAIFVWTLSSRIDYLISQIISLLHFLIEII
jgi:hypothetical protein